jgi:uncharacterized membrane protein YdjX (TVP38/TMEM64 family)
MQPRRLLGLLAAIAFLVVAASLDPVHEAVWDGLALAQVIIDRNEAAGVVLFVVLSAVSAIAFFFSSAVIVPVAIGAWGKSVTMLLLWSGWMLGAALSYWIGSHPGRRVVKWLVPERRVARYERKISAQANFPLVLLFQLAVPSEIPGYVLGALRYGFGKFFAVRAIAEVPFAIGTVYLGVTFVQRQFAPLVLIACAGVAFTAVALYLFHRRVERR